MNVSSKNLLGLFLFSGALLLILVFWIRPSFAPDPNPVLLRIPEGSSARKIADLLYEKGIIHSPGAFLFLAYVTGGSRALHHGTYLLGRNRYLKNLNQIKKGLVYTVKVTIPEGWSAYQIGERLKHCGVCEDTDSFLQAVLEKNAEGMLFPETYFFEPQTEAGAILEAMVAQFRKRFAPEFERRAAEIHFTERDALILASIIEREAKLESERPLISSVYHNRLRKRMPLEADPTVQYALGGGKFWKETLSYKDLRVDSPYNTYRRFGLPPGPICNPGLASIRAALYPAQTHYIFFFADGRGAHSFFENYRSHLQGQMERRGKRMVGPQPR